MSADDKLEPVAWQNPSTGHVIGGAGAQDHRYTQALVPASALEASEAKIAALTAENATLREVLRQIAATRWDMGASEAALTMTQEIARAALRQEGKPSGLTAPAGSDNIPASATPEPPE